MDRFVQMKITVADPFATSKFCFLTMCIQMQNLSAAIIVRLFCPYSIGCKKKKSGAYWLMKS